MGATIIDGKASGLRLRERVALGAHAFAATYGRKPGLVGIQVGEDPA